MFGSPELKISLSGNTRYAAVPSTAGGAPFRPITVRDTIGDLPAVGNGASVTTMEVILICLSALNMSCSVIFLLISSF